VRPFSTVIASGGVGILIHLVDGLSRQSRCVLAASIFTLWITAFKKPNNAWPMRAWNAPITAIYNYGCRIENPKCACLVKHRCFFHWGVLHYFCAQDICDCRKRSSTVQSLNLICRIHWKEDFDHLNQCLASAGTSCSKRDNVCINISSWRGREALRSWSSEGHIRTKTPTPKH